MPKRFGGGYDSATTSYDWFYGLSEQSRPGCTSGIDAAKAVKVGRVLLAARFGGRNSLAFAAVR